MMFAMLSATSLVGRRPRWASLTPVMAIFLVAAGYIVLLKTAALRRGEQQFVTAALGRLRPPSSTVMLSEFLFHGPPVFRALGRPWRLSSPHLWWFSDAADNLSDSVRTALSIRVAADIRHSEVVILDRSTRALRAGATPFERRILSDIYLQSALHAFTRTDAGPFVVFRRPGPYDHD
jgi:hypothetical protein